MGSYASIWLASVVLAIFGGLIHLPITDQPLARLQEAVS